ncbi:DVU0524 family FlgM-associated protein [Fundidesulfovibrio agrisoli]|uniref:DVU0524 family FlgM-associated protein n=1 Tax=Fundidesulfovibrio agrisoli TaxID=2922717 RepID=UPI001FABAB8D|nr:DVU0524 family FlgM-associated protein [Fundidesulfovibrio agrisoli]
MSANPALVRNMLRTYGRQATTARRLARYKRTLRAAGAEDQVAISREARRRELVHKVAAEIVESLIVTGSENPVVEDIKRELERTFKTAFIFAYPPEDQDLQIFKVLGENNAVEATGNERVRILEALWHIALEKVDETMI